MMTAASSSPWSQFFVVMFLIGVVALLVYLNDEY